MKTILSAAGAVLAATLSGCVAVPVGEPVYVAPPRPHYYHHYHHHHYRHRPSMRRHWR
jgi:hypothetical protein